MAFQIPTTEPAIISAGDRAQWKRSFSDYPASAFTLTYYLRGNFALGQIDITAATSGNDFSVDISPATTADWNPGDYYWTAFVSDANSRYQVDSGKLSVLPNPTTVILPVDGRSHARRCLDAINIVMEGRASRDDLKYAMQAVGRSVEKVTLSDLMKFRDYWLQIVAAEEAAESGSTKKNVFIRFN